MVFFLIIRRPPRSTRTDTLFPYTTLCRSTGETSSWTLAQLHPGDRRHPFDGNILLDWRGRVDRNQCHLARSVARLDDLHPLAAVLGLHPPFAAVAFGGVQPFVARVSEILAVLEAAGHRATAHHDAAATPFPFPRLAPVE